MTVDKLAIGSRLRRLENRVGWIEEALLVLAENQHDMLNREMGLRTPGTAVQNIASLASVFEVVPVAHEEG